MEHYVGVDIGGTNIVCGLTDGTGNVLKTSKMATESGKGSAHVVRRIGEAISQLAKEAGVSVKAVGIGVPGFVDHKQGISVLAVNLGWKDLPLADNVSRELDGIPVFVNNDVRMYTYGEAVAGAGRGYSHVLGITLGTGLAAAMINDGQLYYGAGGRAGELGHIGMENIPYRCNCGLTGCLETAVSASGIARQAKEAVAQGKQTLLAQLFPGEQLDRLTAADVSRAYDQGDAVAREIMEHTGKLLGKGLASAITLFSPDVIVIGGGAALAGDRLFRPMREELERSALDFYWKDLHIKAAERNEDAGVVGSALYAKERAEGQQA
ncbi:ROK family protein [Paenibacillus allorhizosphaerae]|uniref:Glucokinase n=1 Tax=Paenibacillus allorhizosphaerae TaxID=2849866 RepID=A0ABM8VTD2_9BACL|nr:ROK family protein [Paenibacillus allorhizosphaerae]CAG7657302.1 Glucokinase [Paenibacillus allorhizosphaerae]